MYSMFARAGDIMFALIVLNHPFTDNTSITKKKINCNTFILCNNFNDRSIFCRTPNSTVSEETVEFRQKVRNKKNFLA